MVTPARPGVAAASMRSKDFQGRPQREGGSVVSVGRVQDLGEDR
ncbi:hypothetical protein ACFWOJ_24865 [Streptomyces sp. NPDC058439]